MSVDMYKLKLLLIIFSLKIFIELFYTGSQTLLCKPLGCASKILSVSQNDSHWINLGLRIQTLLSQSSNLRQWELFSEENATRFNQIIAKKKKITKKTMMHL